MKAGKWREWWQGGISRWDQQRLPQAAAQPNLTEVFYTQPKGQKRNCACTHHFWGTVPPPPSSPTGDVLTAIWHQPFPPLPLFYHQTVTAHCHHVCCIIHRIYIVYCMYTCITCISFILFYTTWNIRWHTFFKLAYNFTPGLLWISRKFKRFH